MSMTNIVNTVVVGGGQGGLSVSHYLAKQSVDHVLLEQADQPSEAWRNHRWDSFTLNTPRWQSRLPGVDYGNDDPDGFMSKQEVVGHFEDVARRLPVRHGARVTAVKPKRDNYVVELDAAEKIEARNVVVATGLYQTPKIPVLSRSLPADIRQLHSDSYRNPEQLLPGAVLVVGSAQSGAQIAEELYESGWKVYLAVGRAGRTPRRYRGKDANWWLARMGSYDRKVSELPSPKAKFSGKPHISGTKGGHTINLHQFARDNVVLLGHLVDVEDGIVKLAGDLHENLAAADRAEAEFIKSVDSYVARTAIAAPEETLPALRDGFAQPILTELDLKAAGITNVIWATGYSFDFSMIKLPVVDSDGFPIQTRGVSAYPGLFFVGLPWLHTAKSGLIYGVAEDACYVAECIVARGHPRKDSPAMASASLRSACERVTCGVVEGFAAHALGICPTASANPPYQAGPAVAQRTRRHGPNDGALSPRAGKLVACADNSRLQMELTMKRKLTGMAATAAAIVLTAAVGHASNVEAPLPPRVDFLMTPTSGLYLGMTAQEVTRIMGEAAKEAVVAAEGSNIRTLVFSGAIPGTVTLTDGKVSRVTLDAFRVDKGDLPAFNKAWPGMAASAVQSVLGKPADVGHHAFFGINVDQWVYSHAGQADVSVFFRADRVVAKAIGREIPTDLFRVALPSQSGGEGLSKTPHAGMMANDVEQLFGAERFRVNYVFNGQPASRVVFETRAKGTFAGVTFVDGVATELEDLGRLPDDATLQGR
jgi:putative flavoprotein involved in K+ transport